MDNKKKSFGKSYRINSKSEKLFNLLLNEEYFKIHEIFKNQYKIDYLIELLENDSPSGIYFKVELKGVEKPRSNEDYLKYSFEIEALEYYHKNLLLPVFIVIIDIRNEIGYWLFAQKFYQDNIFDRKFPKKTVVLNISKKNKITDNLAFIEDIKISHRYMTDIRSTSVIQALSHFKKEMEILDNRFHIDIRSINENTDFRFTPKSPVNFSIISNPDYNKDFVSKMTNVIDWGNTEILDMSKISITGSPIFDFFKDNCNEIKIEPLPIIFEGLLKTIDDSGMTHSSISGIKVEIIRGQKIVLFKCSLPKSIISIGINLGNTENTDCKSPKFSLHYDLSNYNGILFSELPYIDKLYLLFNDCSNGMQLFLDIEEYGNLRARFNLEINKIVESISDLMYYISIIYKAKKIFEHFHLDPIFLDKFLTIDNSKQVQIAHDLLFNGKYTEKPTSWNGKADAIFDSPLSKSDSNIPLLSLISEPMDVNIFGTIINLGKVLFELSNPILINDIEGINKKIREEGKVKINLNFSSSVESELQLSLSQ